MSLLRPWVDPAERAMIDAYRARHPEEFPADVLPRSGFVMCPVCEGEVDDPERGCPSCRYEPARFGR